MLTGPAPTALGRPGRNQPLLTDLRTVSQHGCVAPKARPKDMPSPPEEEGEAVWVWSLLGSWGEGGSDGLCLCWPRISGASYFLL